MAKKKALIIFNPISKKSYFKGELEKVVHILCKNDYKIEIYSSLYSGDIIKKIRKTSKYDLIIASGGDGTLHEVINGLKNKKIVPEILYFPTGTTNDFGHTLGLTKNTDAILDLFIQDKKTEIDVADVDGTLVNYVMAFGDITSVTYNTSEDMKKTLGHIAYIIESVKKLPTINKTHKLIVTIDDEEPFEFNAIIGVISNTRSVAGFRNAFTSSSLNDGMFELFLLSKIGIDHVTKLPKLIKQGIDEDIVLDSMIYKKFKKLKIQAGDDVKWNFDGEKGAKGSIDVKIVEKFYKIYSDPLNENDKL